VVIYIQILYTHMHIVCPTLSAWTLHAHLHRNRRPVLVPSHNHVLVLELVDVADLPCETQGRERLRHSVELGAEGVDVVPVDVGIAELDDELPGLDVCDLYDPDDVWRWLVRRI
jgi:hypothetical protein